MKKQAGFGHKSAWIGFLLLFACLLLACETSTVTPPSTLNSLPTGPGAAGDAQRVQLHEQALIAEHEQYRINATLIALYAQQTATIEAMQATATVQSIQAMATIEAHNATATARAWYATATADAHQATATAEAQQVRSTATAQALAIQGTATARVQATVTAQADLAARATATVEAMYFHATATAIAKQARKDERAAQWEEIIYPLRVIGPWVILGAVALVLLVGLYRIIRAYEMQLRVIPRDARGDAPLIVLEQRRRIGLLDADKGFWPALVFGSEGQVSQPQLTSPEIQERVTMRDQTIDAVTRGLPGNTLNQPTRQRAAQLMTQQPHPATTGPVQIVEPQQVRGWLKDVTPQALRNVVTVEAEVIGTQEIEPPRHQGRQDY